MKLKNIIDGMEYNLIQGDINIDINSLEYDSRVVNAGSLFCCMKRLSFDGHVYVKDAIKKGAVALLVEDDISEDVPDDITIIQVENARVATACIACKFNDNSSEKFKLIGLTGTNGKTTTTYLIENILERSGEKTGLIGTIENHILDKVYESKNTTPLSTELQKLYKDMAEKNVDYVVMEVASHALALNRVDNSDFDIGLFTNLTQDHLDYHKTFENYRNAKLKLFSMTKFNIFNNDDEASKYFIDNTQQEYMTYGIDNKSDIMAKNIRISLTGTKFILIIDENEYHVTINTPGLFSVYNALAAISVCYKLGIDIQTILWALAEYKGVPGRFETFINKEKKYSMVVDYAHTPDGLENVLKAAREFVNGRIITVFGCGGDRDKTKRPKMAKVAEKYSDLMIVTSDNPRTEDPGEIIEDVLEGLKNTKVEYVVIEDRLRAIEKAHDLAMEEDLIMIAGKGHEDYQIIGKDKIHLSDREIVEKLINGEEI